MDVVTLGPDEIRSAVSMSAAIATVRNGFLALHRGEFEMPTRTVLRDGGFLVMSTHHRPTASAMIKTLSLDFDRVPAIAGTVVWSELGHSRQLVADATEVTRIRTGAVTGIATDLLAPPEAKTCTLIGAGAQAADQVRAVHAVRPLTELRIVSRGLERAEALGKSLGAELDLTAVVLTDADEAVRDVDIVCCATTSTKPLFSLESLAGHAHVNAVGAFRPTMRELPDELLAAATVVIDEREAILEESGEIIHALAAGTITEDDLTELGTALAEGVTKRRGRTVFKSVGVAIQDWAIAGLLARICFDRTK
ncbi:ornithine cyclodeaminase family protein [Amycolatopsis sp. EV170708-02-1]|uniref:ornithine cyclodeaminase family protein n=1 Tax=Amycolatopsis sp. EV170708-02-1 TaxID=2919322 RepID=UPI001F0C4A24|nr:ornithine cyclodeaminase family protein [Amycolatopsis sp. EV170708-02-1]UMP04789.1 ornithine cyclodeaminase family protein [Amycolatopsis sp. EV170708-02-1]